jgi:uncharacterized protein
MDSGISVYLLIPFVGWLVAQLLKALFELSKPAKERNRKILRSGGMPSAHSATIFALLTVLGVQEGVDSALFGVVAIIGAIVLYDAVNVRRAVGEHGDVIRELLKTAKHDRDFFSAYGHRLSEVIVGSIIGVAVAAIMLQIL